MSGKKTIYRKICIPILIMLVLEGVLLYACLDTGSMDEQLQRQTADAFSAKVSGCAGVLQEKMREQWADVTELGRQINVQAESYLQDKSITYDTLGSDETYANEFLGMTGEYLTENIQKNRVDGAFLLLCPDVEAAHPYKECSYYGMYFRQRGEDPAIYLEYGDESIARKLRIERSVTWQNTFQYNPSQKDENYFLRPIEEAYSYNKLDMQELGYWSETFQLREQDEEWIMTYTVPLIHLEYSWDGKEDRRIYGAVGIEITMDTLGGQLQKNGDTEYALIRYEQSGADESHITCTLETPAGGLSYGDGLELERSGENDSFYLSGEMLPDKAVSVIQLPLYEKISPYADTCWAVAGITDSSGLLVTDQTLWGEFAAGMLCFVVLNILFGCILIRHSIHPLKKFQQILQQGEEWNPAQLCKGSYLELERLISLISKREHMFGNEKDENRKEVTRYLSALSKLADAVYEYDCGKDVFDVYNLSAAPDGTVQTELVSMEHFMRDLDMKQFCRKEDVMAITKLLKGHTREVVEVKLALRRRMGFVWSAVSSNALLDEEGNVAKVVGTIKDIHQKKKRESEEEEMNRLDPVTKLLNARVGETKIREYLFGKAKDVSVSMCIIELDDFKNLNDYYGLVYGDIILEEVGEILRRYLYDDSIGVRLGGDEFLIFMKGITKEETLRICNSIRDNIREMYVGYGRIKKVTCSIGLVHRNGFVDYNNLLRYANTAMCEVKRQGKDQVEEYFGLYARKGSVGTRNNTGGERSFNRIESLSGNTDIVSVAFNVFERSVDFRSTLHVLMKKIGQDFVLSRIIVAGFDNKNMCSDIYEQWAMFGLDPVQPLEFAYDEEGYEALMNSFGEQGAVLLKDESENILTRHLAQLVNGKNNASGALFCAMYDNHTYLGCIVFRKEMDSRTWNEQEVEVLKTVTNLTAMHYARYLKDEKKQAHRTDVLRELENVCETMDQYNGDELKRRLLEIVRGAEKDEEQHK